MEFLLKLKVKTFVNDCKVTRIITAVSKALRREDLRGRKVNMMSTDEVMRLRMGAAPTLWVMMYRIFEKQLEL